MQLKPKQKGAWARNRKKRHHTIVVQQGIPMHIAAAEARSRGTHNRKTRAAVAHSKARRQQNITQQRAAQEGNQRTAFSEPSVFAYREMSTGRRRQSERAAPGLGPGPAGGGKRALRTSRWFRQAPVTTAAAPRGSGLHRVGGGAQGAGCGKGSRVFILKSKSRFQKSDPRSDILGACLHCCSS